MPPIRLELPAHDKAGNWTSDNVTSSAAVSLANCQECSRCVNAARPTSSTTGRCHDGLVREPPSAFEDAILKDVAFIEQFLRPDDLRLLEAQLGELGPEEVYYPVPYPCLGGSGDLSTFDKGDVWVFADLLGQSLGVG
jgi:hypothetical protein